MSATVCNVVLVVLRTPGESINATMKIKRKVFTLDGDLNVNLFDDIETNLHRTHIQQYLPHQLLRIR